jgi:hypothetical protein
LNVKALRHYDEIGLLAPAWVDPDSGYMATIAVSFWLGLALAPNAGDTAAERVPAGGAAGSRRGGAGGELVSARARARAAGRDVRLTPRPASTPR